MERLSTLTERLEQQQLARAFVALSLAAFHAKGDAVARDAYLTRALGRRFVEQFITKAAVDPIGSAILGAPQTTSTAFLGLVAGRSALMQLAEQALTVPMNTVTRLQTVNPRAYWIEPGGTKLIAASGFDTADLGPKKVVSPIVVSIELTRAASAPVLDALVRSLATAAATAVDAAAFDPSSTATAGRPASLTSLGTEVPASGIDLATDIGLLLAALSDGAPSRPFIVGSWAYAARLAEMIDGLRALGCGVAVSGGVSHLLAVDAACVAVSDGAVELRTATQGDVQMDDGTSPVSTEIVRLWQQNLIALLAERTINWTCLPSACVWMASAGSPL